MRNKGRNHKQNSKQSYQLAPPLWVGRHLKKTQSLWVEAAEEQAEAGREVAIVASVGGGIAAECSRDDKWLIAARAFDFLAPVLTGSLHPFAASWTFYANWHIILPRKRTVSEVTSLISRPAES